MKKGKRALRKSGRRGRCTCVTTLTTQSVSAVAQMQSAY